MSCTRRLVKNLHFTLRNMLHNYFYIDNFETCKCDWRVRISFKNVFKYKYGFFHFASATTRE